MLGGLQMGLEGYKWDAIQFNENFSSYYSVFVTCIFFTDFPTLDDEQWLNFYSLKWRLSLWHMVKLLVLDKWVCPFSAYLQFWLSLLFHGILWLALTWSSTVWSAKEQYNKILNDCNGFRIMIDLLTLYSLLFSVS